MKSQLAILVLSILLFNFTDSNEYSIDEILNYLQSNGLYEVLVEVKKYFGDDVAIALCKEFVRSNDCEKIIRTYISSQLKLRRLGKRTLKNKIKKYTQEPLVTNDIKPSKQLEPKDMDNPYIHDLPVENAEKVIKLDKFLLSETIYPILSKYMTVDEIHQFSYKIYA